VLAFLGPLVAGVPHCHPFGVAAWIVAQQIIDGPDAEHLVEGLGGFRPDDVVEPVAKRRHGYSTPISRASPRCPVS
jgi:hypothetical protein